MEWSLLNRRHRRTLPKIALNRAFQRDVTVELNRDN
jgi:hypothetical protein